MIRGAPLLFLAGCAAPAEPCPPPAPLPAVSPVAATIVGLAPFDAGDPCAPEMGKAFPDTTCRAYDIDGTKVGVWSTSHAKLSDSPKEIEREGPDAYSFGTVPIADGVSIEVQFTEGASYDPQFQFSGGGRALGQTLIAPGNGSLYVIQRMDTVNEVRRKYTYADNALTEVTSGHHWLGVTGPVHQAVIVSPDEARTQPLATVPTGHELTVLTWIERRS